MWEKNLGTRLAIIGLVLLVAAVLIRNPRETLRPGLDIAGGVSMIFEIDNTGLENDPTLAERMKTQLQRRVDPQGVFDLVWRVHGQNRIEVQMPLPPPQVAELRRAYAEGLEALTESAVSRGDLEAALEKTGAAREAAVAQLAGQNPARSQALVEAAAAYDIRLAALAALEAGPQTQPAPPAETQPTTDAATQPATQPTETLADLQRKLREAEENWEDAVSEVLDTNLDFARFQEILELEPNSDIRAKSLGQFKASHPELEEPIDDVVKKHDAWRANRGYLDGPADLQRLLRGAGVLEFRILADPSPENATRYDRYRSQLQERGPKPAPGDEFGWFRVDNPLAFFDLDTPADLERFDPRMSPYVADKFGPQYYVLAKLGPDDGLLGADRTWQLKRAAVDRDEHGRLCVNFELDVVGGQKFSELTRKNIGRQLCILLDDVAYSAPTIQSKISTRGVITGDFSIDKVNYLVQTMEAGSLPARLRETPVSERTIGSSLGATNRDLAFRSGLYSAAAVLVLVALYYGISGLVANVAILMNVALTLAVMALLQARFNLPGIAGVILTLGMSVDANVLINERMREERERGSSLRLIIKNGYDKAFSAIFDSNLTTILTCVIIYYVGSEEIKGFGLTLGWGIVISMFTALFVTRTLFMVLVKYGWLKQIRMMKMIPVPTIDWYGLRKIFIPASLVMNVLGIVAVGIYGTKMLDVEYLGGVSADIEVRQPAEGGRIDDVYIARELGRAGAEITNAADQLADVKIEPLSLPNSYRIRVPELTSDRLAAILTEPLEDRNWLARAGLERHGAENAVTVRLQQDVSADQLAAFVREQIPVVSDAGKRLAAASVGSAVEAGFDQDAGRFWTITTTEKNRRLVQEALEIALGDQLQRQAQINFVFRGDGDRPFPITDRRIENVIKDPSFPAGFSTDPLTDFIGGAALYLTDLDPPISVDREVAGSLPDRLRNMRLQPGFQDAPHRDTRVVGVQPAGQDAEGRPVYSSVVVLVADPNIRYSDDPQHWASEFAAKEVSLTRSALETEQALRKVSQFKPQIAQRSTTQAILALLLAWLVMIGYLWLRFGRPAYGIAGVIALIHDMCMALFFLGLAHTLYQTEVGAVIARALRIEDFRINMTMLAAFLTIIGYSINDKIVIFDRVRELRGRLGIVTPQVINDAINQCMSRTLLTGFTTVVVLAIMYAFGGSSIRGFNYAMLVGVLTGTYSSFAIAAPLLMVRYSMRRRPAAAPALARA